MPAAGHRTAVIERRWQRAAVHPHGIPPLYGAPRGCRAIYRQASASAAATR
jgi:hypothetical protein